MDVSMVIFVLVLLLCLAIPVLIATACMIYCLMTRRITANEKLSSTSPTTISTIESSLPQTIPSALPSAGQTSVVIEHANDSDSFDPSTAAIFKFTRTPFGTRTTATFDLGASLKASWTVTNGNCQGSDSLAAALEGVLALHKQLEALRNQRPEETRMVSVL